MKGTIRMAIGPPFFLVGGGRALGSDLLLVSRESTVLQEANLFWVPYFDTDQFSPIPMPERLPGVYTLADS